MLAHRVAEPLLAFCPERTIQGAAIEELRALPQIVGGINERATSRAADLFRTMSPEVVTVSSLEAAEAIKLICNAHTDLIYGFGNEVASIAEALGLDADELIKSANLNYPRPDLSRPGFVGGSCLTKDPYHLVYSAEAHGYTAGMITSARQVNESTPVRAAARLLASLHEHHGDLDQSKVLLCGIAYKGQPETDDVRGSAAEPVAGVLRQQVGLLAGHDFVVAPEQIEALGITPTGLEEGFDGAVGVMVLTNHRGYAALDLDRLLSTMAKPPIVFDAWGLLMPRLSNDDGVVYMKLGRG
jgi:UDP-N-acetyl-D-mannosaminuronic acid dehydrogenase